MLNTIKIKIKNTNKKVSLFIFFALSISSIFQYFLQRTLFYTAQFKNLQYYNFHTELSIMKLVGDIHWTCVGVILLAGIFNF